jgi:spermidine/putrescine transport system substrate-binding protein
MADDEIRILADAAGAARLRGELTRRGFLGVAGLGAASLAFLAACGGDNSSGSSAATGATAGSATTGAGTTAATTAAGATTAGSVDPGATSFNLYTWAAYDDPDLMKSFGNITIDVYNSNEEAVAKLEAAKGTSGYDMVVPSGPYIPQMAAKGLLEELDLALVPSFKNLAAPYINQSFDPGNKYSVCKDFGSTGWIYDSTVIKTPITSWSEVIKAAQNEGSGLTSLLDAAPDVCGIYFWANGIDWNTEDPAHLDACEDAIVNQLAPHVKAFNSYPGIELAQGNYLLSQVFNGDARQGLLSVDDPERYTWGFGAPTSELWMDNWCILKGAKNRDAAYNFLNFILTPEKSATDLAFHGYDTGITGVRDLLPKDTKFLDMVFLSPQLLTTLVTGEVNTAQDRQVAIFDKAKAKAGA